MARGYVESQIATTTDDYALAISSYALRLAKSSSADAAYTKLNNDAIVKGIFVCLHFKCILDSWQFEVIQISLLKHLDEVLHKVHLYLISDLWCGSHAIMSIQYNGKPGWTTLTLVKRSENIQKIANQNIKSTFPRKFLYDYYTNKTISLKLIIFPHHNGLCNILLKNES